VARTLNAPRADGAQLTDDIDRRRATDAGDPELLRLLVVEDDSDYRAWLVAVTKRMGFLVGSAPDGEAALDRLSEQPYEIAVIDQEMPRMTGIEMIRRIRADEQSKTLYAIMLTGRTEMETKLSALAAGFDDFLSKTSPEAEILAKLVVARRIAARQRNLDSAVRELYGLATRDELTGVFNRRFFVSEAERLLTSRCTVNVALFDLDDFKLVNDKYGHLAGDRVLRDIGTLFDRHTRAEDLIARYGGDEFVMLVPHLSLEDFESMVERLAGQLRALQWSTGQQPFHIGVSTGYASTRLLAQPTLAQLLEIADRDLYKNKALRANPGDRPELYTYPVRDDVRIDLIAAPRDISTGEKPAAKTQPPPVRKRHDGR
jgi:two-component system chemotaxis response regulator CheY